MPPDRIARRRGGPAQITPEDFARIDLRVARVETAEFVEGADRLLRLGVDLGGERRTVFAGIRGAYEPAAARRPPRRDRREPEAEEDALRRPPKAWRSPPPATTGLFLLSPDAGARAGMKVS